MAKGDGKLASPTAPLPDPEVIFRQALCFDYSGQLLCNALAVDLASRAASGELATAPLAPETQTPGGIYLPPVARDPLTESVIVPPAMMFNTPTWIPSFVLHAFATELFLKCIIALNGEVVPKVHELQKLYQKLKPEQQSRVEALFDAGGQADEAFLTMQRETPDVSFTFATALQEMNKAFELWRYAYEPPGPRSGFWGHLWKAAGRFILELRPEWKPIAMSYAAPPTFQPR